MTNPSDWWLSRQTPLVAAGSAAVVLAGLIAVPPVPKHQGAIRGERAAVQLAVFATTEVRAAAAQNRSGSIFANTSAEPSSAGPITASGRQSSSPRAAASSLLNLALLPILLPLWYVAFPITLPINIIVWTSVTLKNPMFRGNPLGALIAGIQAGLINFISMPLPLAFALSAAPSASATTTGTVRSASSIPAVAKAHATTGRRTLTRPGHPTAIRKAGSRVASLPKAADAAQANIAGAADNGRKAAAARSARNGRSPDTAKRPAPHQTRLHVAG